MQVLARRLCWLVFGFFCLIPYAAHAASFDCGLARTSVEHRICDAPAVGMLDEELATTFFFLMDESDDAGLIRREQQGWLRQVRNQCEDDSCLLRVYHERITMLQEDVLAWIGSHSNGLDRLPPALWHLAQGAEIGTAVQVVPASTPSQDMGSSAKPQEFAAASAGTNQAPGHDAAQGLRLLALAALVSVIAAALLVATNRVVIYRDSKDVFWTITMLASPLVGWFLYRALSPGVPDAPDMLVPRICLYLGWCCAAIAAATVIYGSVRDNSIWIAPWVIVIKVFVVALMLLCLAGALGVMTGPKETKVTHYRNIKSRSGGTKRIKYERRRSTKKQKQQQALLFVALATVIWMFFVNGHRVEQQRLSRKAAGSPELGHAG